MKNHITILFMALLFTGCEKIVDLDYKANQSSITIQGNITNETGPYFVKITRSIGLSDTGAYPTIDDAVVTVSDDAGNSEVLTPEGSGLYRTATMEGIEGRTYTLTAEIEGQTYSAQSTMPQLVPFDSIKVSEVSIGNDIERDIIPVYMDPVSKGNNYRFVLTVNSKLVNQHLVQNDEVKNGLVNTLKLEINDDDLEIMPGDLIDIEMQCTDKDVAVYYTTLALMGDSGPGGGTTPSNPPTNISNEALGLFSAHTVERKRVTIK